MTPEELEERTRVTGEIVTLIALKHPDWLKNSKEFLESLPDEVIHDFYPDDSWTDEEPRPISIDVKKARMWRGYQIVGSRLSFQLYLALINYHRGESVYER